MNYSIVIKEELNERLKNHLINNDYQEDLCFALYTTSSGKNRTTGIINEIILPENGDRNLHGNVSFNSQYFDKVTQIALKKQKGIVFIHSHPCGTGWQGMSKDDVDTETMLSSRVKAITNQSLIGMTIGKNGSWSARFWNKSKPKVYNCDWCESVRVVGERFTVTFNDHLIKPPSFDNAFTRTISTWGREKQSQISRLKIGVVGIGSVGSQIAEALVRTGIADIKLFDFDIIERKNLDRLHGVNERNIGYLKSDTFARILSENKLYPFQNIYSIPYSIVEEEGYDNLIDCDILFSCVDKPWARFTLNCISYSYLIPVIDGGIDASFSVRHNNLEQARWRAYIAGPQRRCIKCMGQYKPEDVALEQSGLLEDPTYIKGLPPEHFSNRGENVYAFSMSLASMQMQQFLSYFLAPKGVLYGPKEMDFITGNIDYVFDFHCSENCESTELIGIGDNIKSVLIKKHLIAENTRQNASYYSNKKISYMGRLELLVTNIIHWFTSKR